MTADARARDTKAEVPARPYRLAIFDFDGTLADSFGWFEAELPSVVAKFGLRTLSPDDLAALRGQHARVAMKRMGVSWWRLPALATHLRQRMAASAHHIRLFPGVADALDDLAARGVRLAVVSSNAEETVRTVLGRQQAAIDAFACGVSLFGKAGTMRTVMRRAGVAPNETIAIGDELRDFDAARRVGADFAAVTWGFTAPDAFADAAYRFRSADDWAPVIAPRA